MSEKAEWQPMTEGEREILFQIQQLIQHSAAQGQWAILSQMVEFRDECLTGIAQYQAELLRHVRQIMGLTKAVSDLTQQVKELRDQLTKDRSL